MGCFNGENLIDKVKKLNIKDLDNLAQDIRKRWAFGVKFRNRGNYDCTLQSV